MMPLPANAGPTGTTANIHTDVVAEVRIASRGDVPMPEAENEKIRLADNAAQPEVLRSEAVEPVVLSR